MTPEKLCQELGAYYDRPLSAPQAKPIVKHIDKYPFEKVRELYDLIVNTCESMPRLSRIKDLAEQIGSINKVGCPKCDWTGFLEVRTKILRESGDTPHDRAFTYVAMCECHPGR